MSDHTPPHLRLPKLEFYRLYIFLNASLRLFCKSIFSLHFSCKEV